MSVYKTKSDDGCETTNIDFGSGKIGIGINDKYGCGTMHVVLFQLDNAHPLGDGNVVQNARRVYTIRKRAARATAEHTFP